MGLLFVFAILVRSAREATPLSEPTTITEVGSAALAYSLSQGSQTVTVTFRGCTFSGITTPDADGGALWLSELTVVVESDCSFKTCEARGNFKGGGVYFSACTITIQDSVSFDSCKSGSGGGFYAVSSKTVTIGAVTLTGCECAAQQHGAAICIQGSVDRQKTTFSGAGKVSFPSSPTQVASNVIYISGTKSQTGQYCPVAMSDWEIDCKSLTTEIPVQLDGCGDTTFENLKFAGDINKTAFTTGIIKVATDASALVHVNYCEFKDLKSKKCILGDFSVTQFRVTGAHLENVVSEGKSVIYSDTRPVVAEVIDCVIMSSSSQQGPIVLYESQVLYVTVKGTTFDANTFTSECISVNNANSLGSLTLQNCTFKNHQLGSDGQGDYCFVSVTATFEDNVKELVVDSFKLFDNVFRGTKGICSLPSIGKLIFQNCEFDNTDLAATDVHKGLIVIPGDGAAYDFVECVFVDCHVLGKGGIIVVPEVSESKMLAGAAGDVLLQGCEFSGCSSDQTAEVYIQCSKLTISGGTYSCPETKASSFIEVWITGTTTSTISATFSVNSTNPEEIANPMITLHSVKDSTTKFQQCTFTTTVKETKAEALYVSLQNDGSVSFDKTVSFDVDVEDAVTREPGFTGSIDIQTPEPEPSGDTGGSGSGSGSGSSGGSSAGGDGGNNDNTGLIVGVTCGVIAALIVAGVIVVFVLMFRRRRRFPTSTSTGGKGKDDAEEPVSTGSATGWASKPGDDWDRAQDPGFAMQGNLQYTADAFD